MVNSNQIEFPGPAAVKGGLDWDTVADFPSESLGCAGPGDGTLAVIQEICPLVFRDYELRKHLTLIFWINHELRKKVSLVLINAAEPIIVSDLFDAGNPEDFVAISQWNGIDDGRPVDHHEAVRARNVGSAVKGIADDSKEDKEEQRHGKRTDRQQQANLFAKKIRKDNAREFHAAPPAVVI